jgi:hypothetical protein
MYMEIHVSEMCAVFRLFSFLIYFTRLDNIVFFFN